MYYLLGYDMFDLSWLCHRFINKRDGQARLELFRYRTEICKKGAFLIKDINKFACMTNPRGNAIFTENEKVTA